MIERFEGRTDTYRMRFEGGAGGRLLHLTDKTSPGVYHLGVSRCVPVKRARRRGLRASPIDAGSAQVRGRRPATRACDCGAQGRT